MRRTFTERLTVGFLDRFFDVASSILEELYLPPLIFLRWASGRFPLWMAWDILSSTWAPFIFCRKMRGRYLVWKDRSYRGNDEFHPSLSMNVEAMLTMDSIEKEKYLADLAWRRHKQHEADISRRDETGRKP